MTAEIGHFALILALVVSFVGGVLPLAGAAMGIGSWMRTARATAVILAVSATIAIGALGYAFWTSDFSLLNVARHSNANLPWYYRVSAVWGSHEGSILVWVTALCWWMAAVGFSARQLPEKVFARIMGVLALIACGFFLFIELTSNPFLRLFPPALNGADLNPLLQDPGMIFHPPLLYLGYVGFAVPFAFAMASLMGGRLDVAWARWMRPWTTASWILLTLGIALGSYWSYYELGWGGWWAWDPVENSSLMPWLTGTALMHSLAVTEKRGAFKMWTVFLAILTFALSLLGTFLVRSGVLTSVHAFASDPERGLFILLFLCVVIGVSFLLFALRGSSVGEGGTFDFVSRETALWGNNVLLVVAMATVLLGTLYPLFLDAVGGGKISVGAPYFNAVFGAMCIPVALLLTPGVLAGWKRTKVGNWLNDMLPSLVFAIFMSIAVPLLMGNMAWSAVVGIFLAAWVLAGTVTDAVSRMAGLIRLKRSVFSLPGDWWGMTLAHIGLALSIAGAVMVSHYEVERNVTMMPGQVVSVRDATFRYNGWSSYRGPNYQAAKGSITVLDRKGREIAELYPEKRNYDSVKTTTLTEAAIVHRWNGDLYVSLGTPTADDQGWVVRAYVKPFVLLIWIGSLFMAAGGLFSVFARWRRKKTREDK